MIEREGERRSRGERRTERFRDNHRERLTVVTDREAERCVCSLPTTPTPPSLSIVSIIFSLLRLHPLYSLSLPAPPPCLLPSTSTAVALSLSRLPLPSPPPPFRHRTSRPPSPRGEKKGRAKEANQVGQQRDVLAILSRYAERCFSSPYFNPIPLVPEIFLPSGEVFLHREW